MVLHQISDPVLILSQCFFTMDACPIFGPFAMLSSCKLYSFCTRAFDCLLSLQQHQQHASSVYNCACSGRRQNCKQISVILRFSVSSISSCMLSAAVIFSLILYQNNHRFANFIIGIVLGRSNKLMYYEVKQMLLFSLADTLLPLRLVGRSLVFTPRPCFVILERPDERC